MSQKQHRFRRILLILGAVGILCTLVAVFGLYAFLQALDFSALGEWYSYDEECVGVGSSAAIEEWANLTLPTSADNVFARSVYAGRGDCIVFVSFDMDARELDTFIASTWVSSVAPMSEPELRHLREILQNDVDWAFNSETEYLYGKGQSAPYTTSTQHIVIKTIALGTYRVYVVMTLF